LATVITENWISDGYRHVVIVDLFARLHKQVYEQRIHMQATDRKPSTERKSFELDLHSPVEGQGQGLKANSHLKFAEYQ